MEKIKNYPLVLEIISGSHLYGTNTEDSDKDYVGIILPSDKEVFGLLNMEELDLSIKSKTEDGKNSKEAVDRKFYEFRKFIKLAKENNPNILEILFADDKNIINISNIGEALLDNYAMFIDHRAIYIKFISYAKSQKHKMIIKPENFQNLNEGLSFFYDYINADSVINLSNEESIQASRKLVIELQSEIANKKAPIEIKDSFIKVGDLNFDKSINVKSIIKKIQDRVDRAGHRKDLFLKYGFDTKYGSHCVRLLTEGISLLKENQITFPLYNAEFLKDIKYGKYTKEEVIAFIEEQEKEITIYFENMKNYKTHDFNKIEAFTINILKNHFYKTSG